MSFAKLQTEEENIFPANTDISVASGSQLIEKKNHIEIKVLKID